MKLYGHPGSPFVRKALVVLEEKGIPYELEILASLPPKSPELLALHPLGKIPVLRDGDVVVPDSSVICAYLEKKHPPRRRSRARREALRDARSGSARAGGWPRCARYQPALLARPSFEKAMAR